MSRNDWNVTASQALEDARLLRRYGYPDLAERQEAIGLRATKMARRIIESEVPVVLGGLIDPLPR